MTQGNMETNEGKIVFQGKSTKGKDILVRYPVKKDVQAMLNYINTLSKEKTFIRLQGEQLTLSHETKYLIAQLRKIAKKKTIHLLVFSNSRLIGIAGINMNDRTERHIGIFAISIAKEFRGEGIGSQLMTLVVDEAIKNIHILEIITLGVFSHNKIAHSMYKRFGFVEYGRLPKGIKLQDKYADHIDMYKIITR